jgi:opacity protein-like surface antigen
MLKKALSASATLASVFAMHSALAADLPYHKSPPDYAPPPIFTWTGFYVGFNRGFGGGVVDANVSVAGPAFGLFTSTQTSNRASGFTFGGQAGYNYQFANNLVLGLETDLQWSDIKASHQARTVATIGVFNTDADIHNGIDWFGTTRLRAGYSFGRLLPYVTGGVAYGQVEAYGRQVVGGVFLGSATQTKVGWTVGAGAEYALTDHLSAKAEYLYLQLPGVTGPAFGLLPPPLPPLSGSFSTSSFGAHIVRAGANLKFNGFGDLASVADGGVLALLWAPPTANWTGFYVGVNGGYGGGVVDAVTTFAAPPVVIPPIFAFPGLAMTTRTSNRTAGFVAGGQVGYNYQLSNHVVLGVESDGQWSDVKAWHRATTIGPGANFVFTDTRNGLNWFGTSRLRAGWASGAALAYLTGGVAYGEVSASGTQIAGGLFTGSAAQTKVGWAAGAGAEYALTNNLSLKAEYLYVDFGGVSGPAFGLVPPPFPPFVGAFSTGTFGTHITRAGLNWRFGGFGAAPVAAKY